VRGLVQPTLPVPPSKSPGEAVTEESVIVARAATTGHGKNLTATPRLRTCPAAVRHRQGLRSRSGVPAL
jgi:hypothetical protein